MLKMEIHLELNVPSSGLDVNQVIVLFQQMLDQVLRPKWANAPQQEAPWACPECGSRHGFKRRGSYPRVLRKSSLGRVEFDLFQVTCYRCEHTVSPFPDLLGLEPYQVSTTEFQAKTVDVACQTSYARAVEHIRNLAHVQVSATAVQRWVQGQGTEVTLDETQADLRRAAEYLASAAPYAFTYREHPDGLFFDDHRFESLAISSTSPAERQMREVNRRTDVGARWSVPGVTNLIGLDLIRRFDREQWRALWQLPEQAVHESSVVNLQVSAKAEP